MTEEVEEYKPNFCVDCGQSLVKPESFCTSRSCSDCGKDIFVIRRAEDCGIRIEKGDIFHIPPLTMTLKPNDNGRFYRTGLELFLKQIFIEKIVSDDELVERYKELETNIDAELNGLDCIQHCDLETNEGVDEAGKILRQEGLTTYWYNLARSSNLRNCYEAIESGDALMAVSCAHRASLFKELSLLEGEHLKEILWQGYNCYFDLAKNQGATQGSVKEQRIIKAISPKIKALTNDFLYTFINDGLAIGVRIGVNGVSEETLKALLTHELEEREKGKENEFKEREIKIKENGNKIKRWGSLFTLANALILALYKNWLG
ncbi:hypothetical protein [Zhongshania sp.]|jgi:hypothetical protein|uniref:hypothetical protein n=1 Tax=Zhongshania sp. TaxID=1971902 RepID=UPI0039E67192